MRIINQDDPNQSISDNSSTSQVDFQNDFNTKKSKTRKKQNLNLPSIVNNDDSSYQDYFSNSSDDQEHLGGRDYVKKNTIVTFDTRRQVNKKNKTKEKTIDRRNFIDSATDPDDFYDEGEL